MAGHSKWSKIKRSKGLLDSRRGQLFSRLSKEITVAARLGGGDPGANVRLRSAMLAARAQNMPNDNVDRAIKKGTGELAGAAQIEEAIYEGYAPGGVAVLVEVATDNRNRTAADLRNIFTKNHGNLASSGSVAYQFKRKGQIIVPRDAIAEDRLLEIVLDAGAEELTADDEAFTVATAHDQLYVAAEALRQADVPVISQKLVFIPDATVSMSDVSTAAQVIRLCDALEDNDDVQNVYANFDMPEEVLSKLQA